MFRKLIATAAAAAIALTGLTAAPAQADDDDLLRILAGAATIYIIAKELDGSDKDRKDRPRRPQGVAPIPAACVTDIRTSRGWRSFVTERCLDRAGYLYRLPDACAQEIRTDRGRRDVYSTNCLAERGYRISGRREAGRN